MAGRNFTQFGLSLTNALLEKIDTERDPMVPRSRYIRKLLEEKLEQRG